MIQRYELDLEGLTVESTEISFDPSVPQYDDPVGYQASVYWYTNTRQVPQPDTHSSPCVA